MSRGTRALSSSPGTCSPRMSPHHRTRYERGQRHSESKIRLHISVLDIEKDLIHTAVPSLFPTSVAVETYQRPLSLALKTRSTSPTCGLARPLCGGSREAEMAEKMSVFFRPYEMRRVVCSTSSSVVEPAADDDDTAGSITPARNDLRVCIAPSIRTADILTGVFMLSFIYDHSH